MSGCELGRVVEFAQGLRWPVWFPDEEHVSASSFLRDLAASDCSPATLRSYAYDLLRLFRFLHDRWTAWERAERIDVREFVEWLRDSPVPQRLNRRADAPAAGSVNPITGKAVLGTKYAPRTINHQLSVLFGFYEWARWARSSRALIRALTRVLAWYGVFVSGPTRRVRCIPSRREGSLAVETRGTRPSPKGIGSPVARCPVQRVRTRTL
ncbi:hypothetical protein E0H75_13150 [Kribbella capetownensis]|uniref:Core-binding (CB) domain-containing protein n=1 Tax=Kribbella capetownensis TaxID=1572659 RepID=A0A4R0K187_9ACTN|nr:hypothetical protein E0H75_13150 [Kribbella capetownensis]